MDEKRHLRRVSRVFADQPLYFVTACTADRQSILASKIPFQILKDEWHSAMERHGWSIGSFVVMPDHVHFFCRPLADADGLSPFMQRWKEWTSKRIQRTGGASGPVWQKEFFDHIVRSDESYTQKWEYVRENPVRAGLVAGADGWPYQGHIHFL